MNRSRFGALAWLIMLALTASAVPRPAAASEDPPSAQVDLAALAKQVQEVTDAVLDHHIDPPPRQQMILDGIKAVYEAAGLPIPAGLGRRVSALTRPEQFDALLREVWPRSPAKGVSPEGLQSAMVEGLLGSVPGRASMMSAKEARVAEQLDGNRYVGIHIAIGFDDEKKRPLIQDVFEGGPAQLAGAVKGDLFEEIDGVDTLGMDLRAAVDRLRGEAGTDVVVKVRHPQSKEVRTLKMTRGILPRQTIKGLRQRTNKDWDVLFEGPAPIGYLSIEEIAASTPHELRTMAQQLESEGARALVLDLRSPGWAEVHPTVLLADLLLDGGPIGRVRTADKVETFEANPDALIRGWPMAVLVDTRTSGGAEWLAAALQDNHRAVVVGAPTSGHAYVQTAIPVAGGEWSVMLTTGRMERADGRPLARPTLPRPMMVARGEQPGATIQDTTRGVKPDHIVGAPPENRPARARVREVPSEVPPKSKEGDPARAKAVKLLTEALKPS